MRAGVLGLENESGNTRFGYNYKSNMDHKKEEDQRVL